MKIATIIDERLKQFESWSLKSGAHSPDSTFCVMEAVAFVAPTVANLQDSALALVERMIEVK